MVIDSQEPMVIATSENGNERDFEEKTVGAEASKKPMGIGNEKTEVIVKGESSAKILDAIRRNHTISRKELMTAAGLSGSGVDWPIRSLKKAGKLACVGTTRKRFWVILEKSEKNETLNSNSLPIGISTWESPRRGNASGMKKDVLANKPNV